MRRINQQSKPDMDRCAAVELRQIKSTAAEVELERILNTLGDGALAGEFRREWPIGRWLVDFYFPDIRLAIEVDGGYHRAQTRWRKDLRKTAELDGLGITVLRLNNNEVFGERTRLVNRLREAWLHARRGSNVVKEPLAIYGMTQIVPQLHIRFGGHFHVAACRN